MFGLLATLTLLKFRATSKQIDNAVSLHWRVDLVSGLLVIFIGLRHEVGADWLGYLHYIEAMQDAPFRVLFTLDEPGYLFLNWLGANVWGDIYTVNVLSAAMLVWGLVVFSKHSPRPMLVILLAYPYLLIVVGMGYTRQSAAIGLIMLAMSALFQKKLLNYICLVVLAGLFHKTAVIMLPFAFFILQRHKIRYGLLMSVVLLLLLLNLAPYIDYYLNSYITNEYESSGATLRLLMIAIPSVFFIIYRRKFGFTESIENYFSGLSWSSILLLIILFFYPNNSTAIDRLSLYWIPLQLMILSHLPGIWIAKGGGRWLGTIALIILSLFLLLSWLLFANHAGDWMPYKLYL